jgi:hypothetical protein
LQFQIPQDFSAPPPWVSKWPWRILPSWRPENSGDETMGHMLRGALMTQASDPDGAVERRVRQEQNLTFGDRRAYYFCDVIDKYVGHHDFLKAQHGGGGEDKKGVHPAVDLAAGVGVYTAAYAKRCCPPTFQATLEWYLTEWMGIKLTFVLSKLYQILEETH